MKGTFFFLTTKDNEIMDRYNEEEIREAMNGIGFDEEVIGNLMRKLRKDTYPCDAVERHRQKPTP